MTKKEITDSSRFSIERVRDGWRVRYHPHQSVVVFARKDYKTFDEAVAFIKETYET